MGDLTGAEIAEIFDLIARNPNHLVFVAEEFGQIVGTITLLIEQKFIRRGGKVGHIEDVVTRKGHEGKGIGRMLVELAVIAARSEGCYKIILDCSRDNVKFYGTKCGFEEHGVEMRLDLAVAAVAAA